MNRVILMGRLARDPEIRYSQGNQPMCVAKYTLAVERRGQKKNDDQKCDFIPCIAFGKSGEFAEKYMYQGMRMLVSGRIQTGSYTKQDGTKVYTTDIVVDDQEFADSKGANAGAAPQQNPASSEGFMNIPDIDDEGLPFN